MAGDDVLTPLAVVGLALFATALLLIVGISVGRLICGAPGARQGCGGLLLRVAGEIARIIAKNG